MPHERVRPMTRRAHVLAVACLVVLMLLTSCSSDSKTSGAGSSASAATSSSPPSKSFARLPGKEGGKVVFGQEQEYTSYNNSTSSNGLLANTLILNLTLPQVFITDGQLNQELNTELMKTVTLKSTSPQIVEYVIQPNATWQDGVAINCKDFYLNWFSQNGKALSTDIDPDTQKPKPIFDAAATTGYENISKLDCSADGKTVTTTYDTPFADYRSLFSGNMSLLPAHVLEAKTGIADVTKLTPDSPQTELKKAGDFWNTGWDGFDAAADISGAWYKITSFNKGQDLTLERNEKYYGPRGKLDTIVFKQVPDATQEPAALANNDVQVIYPQAGPDIMANLNKDTGATTRVDFGTSFDHLDFNYKDPILQDKVVREAFALGVDTQEIVNKELAPITDKAAPLGNRLLLTNQDGYRDNRATMGNDYRTPDPDKAARLLTDDGWKLGSDGIRVKNGQRLTLKIGRQDPNPRRQSIIETISSQLKPIGFDVQDAPDPKFNSDLLTAGQFQIALFGWVNTPFFTSSQPIYGADPGHGENFSNIRVTGVADLYTKLATTFDPDTQKDIANQIDVLLWNDMASLPLYQQPDITAYKNNIKNVSYNGVQGPTWNAFDWSLG